LKKTTYALGLILLVAAPNLAGAQDIPGMARPPIIIQRPKGVPYRDNLISFNPLGVVLQYYTAAYEHALFPDFSLAVNGSYISYPDFSFPDNGRSSSTSSWSTDLIARYYPNAEGLRGFGIGASVGYTKLGRTDCVYSYSGPPTYAITSTDCAKPSATTIGVEGDYNWVLGASQHFGVSLGLGAKRYFFSHRTSGSEGVPTAKTSIGYAW
jgi:hypothetical protein